MEAKTGQEHFHLRTGRILRFIENDKAVIQRTAAHIGKRRNFNRSAFQKRFCLLQSQHVMQGVISSGGTAPDAYLSGGRECAGKTGTSENYRDSWFCGFTPEYAVAAWMGNRQEQSTGAVTVSSVFPLFMDQALADVEPTKFPKKDPPPFTPVNDDSLAISSTGYNSVDNAYSAFTYDYTYTGQSSQLSRSSRDEDAEPVDEDGDGYDDITGEELEDHEDDEDEEDEEEENDSDEE